MKTPKSNFLETPAVVITPLKLSDGVMQLMLEGALTDIYGEGNATPPEPRLRVAS